MPSRMNWDDLRIVSAVYRTGSFMRAARDIGIDETTVARRLSRIEAALNTRLFETVDGVRRPSDGCLALMPALAAMEQAATDAQTLIEQAGDLQRRLRLSTIPAIAEHFLAPAIPELLAQEPELRLVIETSDHNVDMSRWEADIAIRLGRPARGAFNVRRIGALDFCLVIPKAPDAGAQDSDSGISQANLLAYTDALLDTPEMISLLRFEKDARVRVQTSDLALIRALVEDGAGVSVLPNFLARSLHGNERIEVRPIEAQREVWLLTQSHSRDDPLARRVVDWCAALFNCDELPPRPQALA